MDMKNSLRKVGYNKRWLKIDLSKLKSNGKKLSNITIDNYINKINYLTDEIGECILKYCVSNRDNRKLEEFIENRHNNNAYIYITPLITIFSKIKKYEGLLSKKRLDSYKKLLKKDMDIERYRIMYSLINYKL